MSLNRAYTTSLSRTVVSTRRRAARSPRLAFVISRSASGRSRLALVSVVWIRPCLNSEVARLASINRSCAGLPPRRGPLVGVGISSAPMAFRTQKPAPVSEPAPAWQLQLLGLAVVVGVVVDVGEGVHHVRRVERRRGVL